MQLMKKTIIVLLVTALVGACAVFVAHFQGGKRAQESRARELQARIEAGNREIADVRAEKERAERQLRDFARASDGMMAHANARAASLSNALAGKTPPGTAEQEGKDGLGKLLNNVMSDPEMKKMIVSQQRMMVGQLYGPLIQKMQLSPGESQAFKDLLTENMAGATEAASSMFSKTGAVDRAEAGRKLADQTQAMEQRVKDLLGEERYAQYQDYQQTVGERAQLGMFRQETTADGEPISNYQVEQLLQVMREEKQQVTAAAGVAFPDGTKGQFPTAMDDAQMEKLLSVQEQVNQNVQARAGAILSPSQLEAFGRHQSNQLQMVRMGLNMARKLMGP